MVYDHELLERSLENDEACFWEQALGSTPQHPGVAHMPQAVKNHLRALHTKNRFQRIWVRRHFETGTDPALFGRRGDTTYLLGRWGTTDTPMRTEAQLKIFFLKSAKRRAIEANAHFRFMFATFVFIAVGGCTLFLLDHGTWPIATIGVGSAAFLWWMGVPQQNLEVPCNIHEHKAWDFARR